MTCDNIVRLTMYMVADAVDMLEHNPEARRVALEGATPSATLIYIAALGDPDMIIEVDVVAAKVD